MHKKTAQQERRQTARKLKAGLKALNRERVTLVNEKVPGLVLVSLGFVKIMEEKGLWYQNRWYQFPTITLAIPRGAELEVEALRCNHGVSIGTITKVTMKNGRTIKITEFGDTSTETVVE